MGKSNVNINQTQTIAWCIFSNLFEEWLPVAPSRSAAASRTGLSPAGAENGERSSQQKVLYEQNLSVKSFMFGTSYFLDIHHYQYWERNFPIFTCSAESKTYWFKRVSVSHLHFGRKFSFTQPYYVFLQISSICLHFLHCFFSYYRWKYRCYYEGRISSLVVYC